jgi:hypothetical protein
VNAGGIGLAFAGALLVGFLWEVNPRIGGLVLALVLLGLLGAAYRSGSLKGTS